MNDPKRISFLTDGKNSALPDDVLEAYLSGKLTPEKQREVEEMLSEQGMESDAMEGLRTLPAEQTKETVERINYALKIQIGKGKRKRRTLFTDTKWAWVAVLIILLLCLLAYGVMMLLAAKG